MGSQQDLENRVSILEDIVRQLIPAVPGLQRLLLMLDVNVGATTPLADGNALVWSDAQHAFVNGAASGGFPVGPEDNGTETGSVEFDTFAGASLPGALVMLRYVDGTPSDNSFVAVFVPANAGVGATLRSSEGDVVIQGDSQDVILNATGGAAIDFNSAIVKLNAIPTSNPGGSGHVWDNGGVLNIT